MLALHHALALWAHQILEGLTPKPGLRWDDRSSLKLSSLLPSQTRVPKRRHARLQRRRSHRERGHPALTQLYTLSHWNDICQCPWAPEPQTNSEGLRPPWWKASKWLKKPFASRHLLPQTTVTIPFGEHKLLHQGTQNFCKVTSSSCFLEFLIGKKKKNQTHERETTWIIFLSPWFLCQTVNVDVLKLL